MIGRLDYVCKLYVYMTRPETSWIFFIFQLENYYLAAASLQLENVIIHLFVIGAT